MQFGLYVPPFGDYASARVLANLAKDAEDAGWDGFFTWDHLAFDWVKAPLVDPWIAYAAIAMNTSRIRFGPMVTPLPRRRPWKVARETVSLDHLSNGRMTLGVGLGGGPAENAAFGEASDPKELGERLDEGLEVLAGLWSGKTFHYEGQYYQVKEALFLPRPVQQPRIPVWVAGYWPLKAKQGGPFRRAARWDGIFPLSRDDEKFLTPQDFHEIIACVQAYRTEARPFDVLNTGFTDGANPARAAEWVASYAAAGVTWWMENINPFRFGWRMEGGWPVDAMRERILQGPPRGQDSL